MARERAFKEVAPADVPSAEEFKAATKQATGRAAKPALDPTKWPLPTVGEEKAAEPPAVVAALPVAAYEAVVEAAPTPTSRPAAVGSAAELVVADFKAAVQAIDGMELKAALDLIEARIAIVRAVHGI